MKTRGGDQTDKFTTISYIRYVTETDKAKCFEVADGDRNKRVWIPKSVLGDEDEDQKELEVRLWFARKENL